ncbi:hypothetical protein HBA55_34670 [Pseudomaricurvus alkylphenolicus]|uniref:hypothetical protein n=1 Tax=Pseudomaricurvus alkylphenolicus TaxID=1306991 RepID=UPI001421F060|nr:hypothetical protein [Pseudomaricurvus alkylphenolicus]NIB44776.1 hypothetical protein [Pseudomaricurvus alkylphenolicus]
MSISYDSIRNALLSKGYRFFDDGDYNLNLVGIRGADKHSNQFNDWLTVSFRSGGQRMMFAFLCTTDPGLYWRAHPANVLGTAIVRPGQYPGLWRLGKHQGRYPALVQCGLITVYRDNDRDSQLDSEVKETGLFGINCHRATPVGESTMVDRWSAGCQVLASAADFDILMALCRKAAVKWGERFSYTLIEEADLWK